MSIIQTDKREDNQVSHAKKEECLEEKFPKEDPKYTQLIKSFQSKKDKKLLSEDLIKNERYYLYREKAFMIEKYGKDVYMWNKENESSFSIPNSFLEKHSISPEVRKRMVDWMVEVFSAYSSEPGTFELAVHIMDEYLFKTEKKLKDSNILLIGLASIYLASKMQEKVPMRLIHIVKNLGKDEYSNKQIIEIEKELLQTTNFDIFAVSTYDYLMTFFWDLKVNNSIELKEFNEKNVIDIYMNFCVFLSKLVLYNQELVTYGTSLIAIAILSLGYDFLKTNDKVKDIEMRHFLRDWIFYLMNVFNLDPEAVSIVYWKIHELFKLDILLCQKIDKYSNNGNYNSVSNLFLLYSDYLI